MAHVAGRIIVVLKERCLHRELKDLDFSSSSMERRERQGPSPKLRTTKLRNRWVTQRSAGKSGLLKGATGATLVELMIGMSISIVMMAAVVMAIQTQGKSSSRETDRVDLTHNLQNVAIRIEKDLRMAGYQTVDSSALYTGAITVASPNTITFLYDTDGSTATGDAKGRETITFRLDTAADAGYIAAHPRLLKVTAAGILPIAADVCANTAVPCTSPGVTFTYYDSAGAVTAVLNDIRNIMVTINGRSPRKNRDTNAYRLGSLTIRVTPRNFG